MNTQDTIKSLLLQFENLCTLAGFAKEKSVLDDKEKVVVVENVNPDKENYYKYSNKHITNTKILFITTYDAEYACESIIKSFKDFSLSDTEEDKDIFEHRNDEEISGYIVHDREYDTLSIQVMRRNTDDYMCQHANLDNIKVKLLKYGLEIDDNYYCKLTRESIEKFMEKYKSFRVQYYKEESTRYASHYAFYEIDGNIFKVYYNTSSKTGLSSTDDYVQMKVYF